MTGEGARADDDFGGFTDAASTTTPGIGTLFENSSTTHAAVAPLDAGLFSDFQEPSMQHQQPPAQPPSDIAGAFPSNDDFGTFTGGSAESTAAAQEKSSSSVPSVSIPAEAHKVEFGSFMDTGISSPAPTYAAADLSLASAATASTVDDSNPFFESGTMNATGNPAEMTAPTPRRRRESTEEVRPSLMASCVSHLSHTTTHTDTHAHTHTHT